MFIRDIIGALVLACLATMPPTGRSDDARESSHATKLPAAPRRDEATRVRNAEMKRRVDAWLAEGEAAQMPVHVVYLTCSDQAPFKDYRIRLNRVLTEIQQWFADQHEAAGFGRTTLGLEREADGLVRIHEGKLPFAVESRQRANIRQTHQACNQAARGLLAKSDIDYDRSFVLVLTTIPDDHGAAPFFGSILQDRGYCFAVDTPWLDTNYLQTSGPRVWKGKPVGPANSALIGGIAHELGHGLGLPHSDEPEAEKPWGESLMASGNYTWREEQRGQGRGSYLLDTDAMLLIARPPFARRVRALDKQPQARLAEMKFRQGDEGSVHVSGRIITDIPVHAIKLFDDPPGGGDYNAIAYAALPDADSGAFEIAFPPHAAPGEHALRLVLLHVNGRWTQFQTKMPVDKQGKTDLGPARATFAAQPQ